MSEGPIKSWRDSWKPPIVTTRPNLALHYAGTGAGGSYCGRKNVRVTDGTRYVDCSECLAALRADGMVSDES
jgi:hypothetical protein